MEGLRGEVGRSSPRAGGVKRPDAAVDLLGRRVVQLELHDGRQDVIGGAAACACVRVASIAWYFRLPNRVATFWSAVAPAEMGDVPGGGERFATVPHHGGEEVEVRGGGGGSSHPVLPVFIGEQRISAGHGRRKKSAGFRFRFKAPFDAGLAQSTGNYRVTQAREDHPGLTSAECRLQSRR
jgi:hypothetical protein